MGDLIYPAIPDPIATTDSLLEAVAALKQAVELLNGQRIGTGTAKAVTVGDLAYVFGTGTLPTGTTPLPGTGASTALAAARAAAQLALQEARNALQNATNDIQNSQQEVLTEFQLLLDEEEGLRIDGDNALQAQVDAIVLTNDEGAIAAITVETAARISADDALAGQIVSLSATVDGNAAAIANEAVVRAGADSALASQISTIIATSSGQRVFVQSTPPTAISVGDIWIDTAQGNLMKIWDGGAWVDRQDNQIDVNTAAISTEQIARANSDNAIANQITTLIAAVDDNEAAITEEALVRADADDALAGQITTLSTTVGSNTAAITAEATTRANADSALSGQVTTLTAQTNTNTSAITTEQIARTNADTALTNSVNTLSTTVNGHTSQITTQQTSLNGLLAEYSVTLNANGHIAGFQINSGGPTSNFIVQADKFQVVSATNTGLAAPFTVIGADTFINRVVVNNEIVSSNYAHVGGVPTAGFRAGSDGLLRAYDARFVNTQSVGGTFDTGTFINLTAMDAAFVDFAARGGTFTERPVLLATPNFRNGVPDNLCSVSWNSPGNIVWTGSGDVSNFGVMGVQRLHRTPETFHMDAQQRIHVANSLSAFTSQPYFVPPGKRLPPVMVADLSGNSHTIEWRDDGTIVHVQYNGSGGVSGTNTARGWWIYDVEKDPLNLDGKTKMYAGLGFTRYAQPLRVPASISTISFKVWGAGGAKDDGGSPGGGAGGYVAGSFAVGTRTSASLIKHGDMLWLLPGEGGKSKTQDVIFGFGGRGQAQSRRASGGGLSGVFVHSVTRANALLIAGGGGGAEGGQEGAGGGPAGATTGGGTTVGTDDEIMTGLPWTYDGSNQKAAGGGGYFGGGYLTASGGNAGGKGGTNFIRTGATATTDSSSTSQTPPNSGDADYTARRYCLGNLADVGEGKTSDITLETGGNGLIVVSFA